MWRRMQNSFHFHPLFFSVLSVMPFWSMFAMPIA